MNRTIAAVASLFLMFTMAAVSAQPLVDRGPTITVRGDGRAEVSPDLARLTADVVTRGKTLEAASGAHKERASKAAAALRELAKDGLEIVQSTFRLDQTRQPAPQSGPRADIEYQAVTTFELKSKKLDRIDDVVTAIAASGLFELRNLRFTLDETGKALDIARREAVADARNRAETYAEAAGVRLGDIVEISDTEPRLLREAAMPMAARSMQIAPPESVTVTAGITMTWRLRP
jgi:uncharacterized protein YggE